MENDNDRTEVIILTSHYRVEGRISLVPDARVTDFVLNEEKFIVVTDAEVKDEEDNVILTSSFLTVNRDNIEIIMPVNLAHVV